MRVLVLAWVLAAVAAGAVYYYGGEWGMSIAQRALQSALPLLIGLLVTARALSRREAQPEDAESVPQHVGTERATDEAEGRRGLWKALSTATPGDLLARVRAWRGGQKTPVKEGLPDDPSAPEAVSQRRRGFFGLGREERPEPVPFDLDLPVVRQQWDVPVAPPPLNALPDAPMTPPREAPSSLPGQATDDQAVRSLRAELEEMRGAVARELGAARQAREMAERLFTSQGHAAPDAAPDPWAPPGEPTGWGPGAVGSAELAALRAELEEARRKAERDVEAVARARETAQGLETQARGNLEQASAIQDEAVRFRDDAREMRAEAAALQADAQDAREAARLEAERLRREAEDEGQRLRGEGREAKAQAEAELESARRLSAEADSLRGTVQRELEQVRRMRQDLRREPQHPVQPSRRRAAPSEPEAAPPARVEAPANALDTPPAPRVEVPDLPSAPEAPPRPSATPSPLEAMGGPVPDLTAVPPIVAQPRPAPPEAPLVKNASQGEAVADLEQALQNLGLDANIPADQPRENEHEHGDGHEHGEVPSQPVVMDVPEATALPQHPTPPEPGPPVGAPNAPTYAELAKALEGLGLPDATDVGDGEAEPASPVPQLGQADVLGASGLDQELAAILENVPASPADTESVPPGGPGGDASLGGPFTGQFHVAVKPLLGSGSLGRFWTALEKAVGLGNILATAPLADRSGIEFTVDVGRDKVALDEIVGSLPQADVTVEARDRVAVTLPDYW